MWLCAGAGSGKSRIIEAVRQGLTERGWSLLDDPPAAALMLMRRLKATFDPRGIFNPGCFVGGL